MASLADIRARLRAQEEKNADRGGQGESPLYPHWNIDEGQTAVIRFTPDGNADNPFFWVERNLIKLPFNGIKGEHNKKVVVNVPCIEMWPGKTCPILTEVRPWFKDKSLEEQGRTYWKKRSYLFQGFVRDNPITSDRTPENPIRRFIFTPGLFPLVKNALLDPEMEELPTDYLRGLDFRISKGSKGGFADYSGSSWARRESALTDEEHAAIEKYGLVDLSTLLPAMPTDEDLKVMMEMFEASVDGHAYDPERWGNHFKPSGFNNKSEADEVNPGKPATPVESKPAAQAAETKPADLPWESPKVNEQKEASPAAPSGDDNSAAARAAAMLARINARPRAE